MGSSEMADNPNSSAKIKTYGVMTHAAVVNMISYNYINTSFINQLTTSKSSLNKRLESGPHDHFHACSCKISDNTIPTERLGSFPSASLKFWDLSLSTFRSKLGLF